MATSSAPLPRVAHLSTAHGPRDNRIFRKECTALAEAGLDVWLIVGQDHDEVDAGVKTVAIRRPAGRVGRLTVSQWQAWRALRRVKPDVLHIHDPELIPLALMWRLVTKKAVIYDAHEDLVEQIAGKRYLNRVTKPIATLVARLLIRLADRHCAAIVAATPTIATKFTNQRVQVVHNFPWLRDYPSAGEQEPVPGRVVYAGMLTQARLPRTMVEATLAVASAHLYLVGKPDAPTAALLDCLASEPRVDYQGAVPARTIPAVIATGNIGLVFMEENGNNSRSLPTKLFEYMASRRPFVATNFAYWQELLGEFDCGVFVDTTNMQQVAAALTELLADPSRCAQMGERGRAAIESTFNFEADVPALVALTHAVARR